MESWNARLREALVASFDDGGLELLSADIGVDYETLEGTSRPKKAFELVDYSARSGRIVELIDMAAARRPHAAADWPAFRAAAIATPGAFRLAAATSGGDASAPVALTPAALANPVTAAALRIGFIAGALLILLLGCVFSAGIVLGSSLPLGPRPSLDRAGAAAVKRAADATPVGGTLNVVLSNGAATAFADEALRASGGKEVTDVGVRFADNGDMTVSGDVAQLGGRQVALVYTISNDAGKLNANLKGAAVNVFGNSESSFGWVAVPASFVTAVPSVAAAQNQLNRELNNYSVKSLAVQQGSLKLTATRLR